MSVPSRPRTSGCSTTFISRSSRFARFARIYRASSIAACPSWRRARSKGIRASTDSPGPSWPTPTADSIRELLLRFVGSYQRVQPLTIGELWAVAITLRIVLVENLRRSAEQIACARIGRQEADALADRLLGVGGRAPEAPDAALRRFDATRLPSAFVVRLLQRLRDQDPRVTPALVWLDQRLANESTTAEAIVREEHQRQVGMNVTVRNVITSMRLISALDWTTIFESMSLVDAALRAESHFAEMDFPTRDRYRHAIEELARGSGRTELDVAQHAIASARQVARQRERRRRGARERDPGYYLISSGRRALEKAIGFRMPIANWAARAITAAGIVGYVAAIGVVAAFVLAVPLVAVSGLGVGGWTLIVLAVLAVAPDIGSGRRRD